MLFAGLESINNMLDTDEVSELKQEIEQLKLENVIQDDIFVLDQLANALDNLSLVKTNIEQYGVTPAIEALAGSIDLSTEGLKDKLKAGYEKVKKFIMDLIAKIKNYFTIMFSKSGREIKALENILTKANKKLNFEKHKTLIVEMMTSNSKEDQATIMESDISAIQQLSDEKVDASTVAPAKEGNKDIVKSEISMMIGGMSDSTKTIEAMYGNNIMANLKNSAPFLKLQTQLDKDLDKLKKGKDIPKPDVDKMAVRLRVTIAVTKSYNTARTAVIQDMINIAKAIIADK